MPKVMLGIGSNIDREENIRSGVNMLYKFIDNMKVSPVYESPSFGFVGNNFYNLVVSGSTELELNHLASLLRDIEYSHGRQKQAEKFSSRTLDIDILIYGRLVGEFDGVVLPRDEILRQAYVLKPLADIAPEDCHPQFEMTFQDLWRTYSGDKRQIWQSDFQLAWPQPKQVV